MAILARHNSAHMSTPPAIAAPTSAKRTRGLVSIFVTTFFELTGYFMLSPWLLLRLKADGQSSTLAGLFAACGWLGIFLITPFASTIVHRLGARRTLRLSALVPALSTLAFALTDSIPLWFLLAFAGGTASGLRWILAEAVVAELSPPDQRGRYVGLFETMVGATFVLGPALLVGIGPTSQEALYAMGVLVTIGWLLSLTIPPISTHQDSTEAHVGWRGVWRALSAHPVIMTTGFVGGFFESGLTSMLPLYGLALGLGAAAAALLVSASGLGSSLMMLPAGALTDRLVRRSQDPVDGPARARRGLMRWMALITLAATLLVPMVAQVTWLAAVVAFVWGGAGGSLYTLAMIDIGSREKGITLVNSTAVLVMSYTLGGMLAPALGAAVLDFSPALGFPLLLCTVALGGVAILWRNTART